MHKKLNFFLIMLLFFFSTSLAAAINLDRSDTLYDQDAYPECKSELQMQMNNATSPNEEAEILWRLARVQVSIGDELDEKDKEGRYKEYEEGEAYAIQSIEKHPSSMAYLWKASNNGRWGQTKGPLNALGKAKGMLEDLTIIVNDFKTLDSSETWYVFSSLYDELPGGMISFGDKDWAISYMRMAMDTLPNHLLYPGHYKKLAEELYSRNWSASKRSKEIKKMQKDWENGKSNLEKYRYYEGKDGGKTKPFYSSVPLTSMSDRQEAVMVLSFVIAKHKVFSGVKPSDTKEMDEILELFTSWT